MLHVLDALEAVNNVAMCERLQVLHVFETLHVLEMLEAFHMLDVFQGG